MIVRMGEKWAYREGEEEGTEEMRKGKILG